MNTFEEQYKSLMDPISEKEKFYEGDDVFDIGETFNGIIDHDKKLSKEVDDLLKLLY